MLYIISTFWKGRERNSSANRTIHTIQAMDADDSRRALYDPSATGAGARSNSVDGATDASAHAAAVVNAGDVADMALEIEGDVIKSHMELLRTTGMVLDTSSTTASTAVTTSAPASSSSNSSISSAFAVHHVSTAGPDDSMGVAPVSSVASVAAASAAAPLALARTATTTLSRNGPVVTSASVRSSHSSPGASISAVYRWYDVEETFHLKRKEESSIAKCTLCRQQGKVERKTFVRFSKSVTSNLWRHLKENHPDVYSKHASEKKSVQMHHALGAKKRGRKKKVVVSPAVGDSDALVASDKLLSAHDDVDDPDTTVVDVDDARKAKKHKRADAYFHEYAALSGAPSASSGAPNSQSATSGALPAAVATTATPPTTASATVNVDKVREAIGYLCLSEMLPFDVCASHAFRAVMLECAGGAGGYLDDTSSFALFGKEIACGYAKKLAADAKVRVAMQMKVTDIAHLMVTEWTSPVAAATVRPGPSSATVGDKAASAETSAPESALTQRPSAGTTFLALFAVGLDQEFNAFRRCLHVLPVSSSSSSSNSAALLTNAGLKQALARVTPCKYMPHVLAIEPPSAHYDALCKTHKLASVESVASLLQTIVLATLHGIAISAPFHLGSSIVPADDAHAHLLLDRRLDSDAFIESPASAADEFYELLEPEVPTRVLEELPSTLTGHTLRDLVWKVLYLLAHVKHSRASRRVLQKIALNDVGMPRDVYLRVFVAGLRATRVSFSSIYYALTLILEMMAPLQRYFALHRDGHSDLSKLVQLASLSPYEWSRIAYLRTVLKPFADATRKLEAERYVLSSLLIPSIFTLMGKLRDPRRPSSSTRSSTNNSPAKRSSNTNIIGRADDNIIGTAPTTISRESPARRSVDDESTQLPEDIVALQDAASANLATAFGYLFETPETTWSRRKRETFNLLWSATLLDPRTRPFIIKGPLGPLEFWDVVKSEAAHIAGAKTKDKDDDSSADLTESAMALDDDSSHLDDDSDAKASGDLWDDLQANLTSCAQEEMLLSAAKSSLEMAKSTNLLEIEVSFFQDESHIALQANPLEWWANMRIKYPFLARLARYVLALPLLVRVDDNPVALDNGLVQRAQREMSLSDVCDLLAASMNVRTEKNSLFDAANKPMWSTV